MYKILYILSIFLASVLSAAGTPSYTFTRYLESDGAPTTTVEKIIRDDNGYLWLATMSGLYRFNGESFTNYMVNEKSQESRLTDIDADSRGYIWALNRNGNLHRFNPGTETMEKVPVEGITRAFKLSGEEFMLETRNGKIYTISCNTEDNYYEINPYTDLPHNAAVNEIFKDSGGSVWILSSAGIYKDLKKASAMPAYCHAAVGDVTIFGSSGGMMVRFTRDGRQHLSDTGTKGNITLITPIPNEADFLIGTSDNRLFTYNFTSGLTTPIENNGAWFDEPAKATTDLNDNIWIYSAHGGINLFRHEDHKIKPFYNGSLQSTWDAEIFLNSALIDRQGTIWLSGSWGGLERATPNSDDFSLLTINGNPSAPANANNARAVYQDNAGYIYTATRDGHIHIMDSLLRPAGAWHIGCQAYSITQTGDSRIWIGSKGGGIIENRAANDSRHGFNPVFYRKSDLYYTPNGDLVYCLRQSADGRLWIASFDGSLSYADLSSNATRFISKKNRFAFPTEQANMLRHINFGPDGRLYTGGNLGLFVCSDPGAEPEQLRFDRFAQVREYDVQHILFTRDSSLWLSTSGNGFLHCLSADPDSRVESFTTRNGIMSNFVLSAIEDPEGNIWIASNGGLNKFNPETGSILGYTNTRIGLPEGVRLNEGEPLLTADGHIIFCTTAGLLRFNPRLISNSAYIPKIIVDRVIVSGQVQTYSPDEPLRVRSKDKITLRYSAIDLTAPEHILYSYKLEGKDEEWHNQGNKPTIHLHDLRPGRYKLMLRSTNADGLAVDNITILPIYVRSNINPLGVLLSIAFFLLLLAGLAILISEFIKRREPEAATASEEVGQKGMEDQFRSSLTAFLESNIENGELTVRDICDELNISRTTLFNKCRSVLGGSPLEILRDMRFERARELILSGRYSLSQVAFMCGFNDSHYFSKAFRQRYGEAPSAFRKRALRQAVDNKAADSSQQEDEESA